MSGHEPIPATQFPDIRTRLVDELNRELASGNGPITETFRIHVLAGAQAPADRHITDAYQQSRALARHERDRLARAALYWVSPSMTTLTLAAAPGMPPFRPTPRDLPSPYGLIYFASPFAQANEIPVASLAVHDDGTIQEIKPGQFQVAACAWGPHDYQGLWPHGGTWFSFYTLVAERPAGMPPLRLDNECVVGAHCDHPNADELLAEVVNSEGTAAWMHLILTAFRLMATSRAARVTEQGAVRPMRRRAARAGVTRPDAPVRLVDVTARPGAERTPVEAESGRTYRVRWLVQGHWRNQWYPASETHRPRYIDAYVKGPEGAPLQVKDTVNVWRDDAETGASR